MYIEMDARLNAVGDPELREVLLFARRRPAPVSADDAAAALGIHRNVARARLERLAQAGLLTPSFERRTGRAGPGAGRPAKVYAVAPELSALEFPDRGFGDLVALLAAGLSRRRLRAAGEAFGRLLAQRGGLRATRSLRAGLERVCATVGRLGYQVSVSEIGERHAVLATPTCPLRPLIAAHPEAVALDEGMWAGLVGAGVRGWSADDVTCETRDCLDEHASCRVVLRLRKGR
jgi:predicted ArsR family transcriptional regulator